MAPKTKIYTYLDIVESHYIAGVGQFTFAANYRLFALMANVRNEGGITPVSLPKGFPAEMSKGAQFLFNTLVDEGADLHSQTFLTTAELAQVVEQADTFAPGAIAALGAMKALEAKGSNPRLLIAFEG